MSLKNTKKILSIAIILVLCLSMAGCQEKNNDNGLPLIKVSPDIIITAVDNASQNAINSIKGGDRDWKETFKNSIICGDSITEGLTAYGFLDDSNVYTKIGASIYHNRDLIYSAANKKPQYLFLAFGMNDMGMYSGNDKMFYDDYTEAVKKFKEISPDTKIYINYIVPPSKSSINRNSIYGAYDVFNKRIKEMANKLNLNLIDNRNLIDLDPSLRASDGIHMASDYYKMWLNLMAFSAKLS